MKTSLESAGILFKIAGLLVLFTLSFLSASAVNEAQLRFTSPVSLRLPNNKVQRVYQDRKGFLWIGTTQGLYRFDGYEVQTFKNDLYNNVRCITEDNAGRLWVGMKGALKVLHPETGEFESYELGLESGLFVNALCALKSGDVLIGTDNGLYRYDARKRQFVHIFMPLDNAGRQPSVQAILQDKEGNVWVGTWTDGLWRWDIDRNKLVRYPAINARNSIHYLFQDSKGYIWAIGWNAGLFRLQFSKNLREMAFISFRHNPSEPASLGDNMAYCIVEDQSAATIWVGSRGGLSITDRDKPGKFVNYNPGDNSALPYGEVDALAFDKEGGVWLGSLGGGVFYNNDRRLSCKNLPVGVGKHGTSSTLSAVALGAEDDHSLWIGLENSALCRYDLNTGKTVSYQSLPEFSGLTLTMINSIATDKKRGETYFAYNGGIAVYKKGQNVRILNTQNAPFLSDYHINRVYVDRDGNLFTGSWKGFGYRLADGFAAAVTMLKTTDGKTLTKFEVNGILRDTRGNLWLSTSSGLLQVRGNLKQPSSLRAEMCDLSDGMNKFLNPLCLYEDSHGTVWVGSEDGLSSFNPSSGRFENRSQALHLSHYAVYSILQDEQGDFWVGTNIGLVHILKRGGAVASRVYTTEDGLSGNYFNAQSAARIGNLLFFGNGHGVECVNTAHKLTYGRYVNVSLTGLNVNGTPIGTLPPEKRTGILGATPEYCDEITIPSKYDDFTLFFSALSFRNLNRVRYAYKMDGLDNRWQYTDSYSHFAHYNQLPPGTYRFMVKAMNDDGEWSEVKVVKLNILPPFYATWWAYTLYVLLLLAAGYRWFMYYKGKQALLQTLNMHTMAVYDENSKPAPVWGNAEETVSKDEAAGDEAVVKEKMEIPVPNMDDVKVQSDNEVFLAKAVSVVKEHLQDEDYTVDRFVSDMSMSKSAVYKRMKALTGMNTSSFIKNIRLKAAIEIMKQNCEVRISDLAYLVGFSDPKYFSACFKKEYGLTPSEYIDRFLKK